MLQVIPPEIHNDQFCSDIQKAIADTRVKTILEIGSASGAGSTAAIVQRLRPEQVLYCVEASEIRFGELQLAYRQYDNIRCINLPTVLPKNYPTLSSIRYFYHNETTRLNAYGWDTVRDWYIAETTYLHKYMYTAWTAFDIIYREVPQLDAVLIDGSEFTGELELKHVYGALYLMLDDTQTHKNYRNMLRLLQDHTYTCVVRDDNLRNGYAIFQRK